MPFMDPKDHTRDESLDRLLRPPVYELEPSSETEDGESHREKLDQLRAPNVELKRSDG
jgi:hypothetical protein